MAEQLTYSDLLALPDDEFLAPATTVELCIDKVYPPRGNGPFAAICSDPSGRSNESIKAAFWSRNPEEWLGKLVQITAGRGKTAYVKKGSYNDRPQLSIAPGVVVSAVGDSPARNVVDAYPPSNGRGGGSMGRSLDASSGRIVEAYVPAMNRLALHAKNCVIVAQEIAQQVKAEFGVEITPEWLQGIASGLKITGEHQGLLPKVEPITIVGGEVSSHSASTGFCASGSSQGTREGGQGPSAGSQAPSRASQPKQPTQSDAFAEDDDDIPF